MSKSLQSVFWLACLLYFLIASTAQGSQHPYISSHGVVFSTGNKFLSETDISLTGPVSSLTFSRNYNSQSTETGLLGFGWTYSWNDTLSFNTDLTLAIYTRSDGRAVHFDYNGTDAWINEVGKKTVITEKSDGTGYVLTRPSGTTLTFNNSGQLTEKRDLNNRVITLTYTADQLTTITDDFGRSLSFTYTTEGKISTITTPLGTYTYVIDANDNLTSVTSPDNTTRTYLYEDPEDIHNLTSVRDEEDAVVQTIGYDEFDRVISSALKDGSEAITIDYQEALQRVVTDSLGVTTTYQLEVKNGVARVASYDGPGCSSCGSDTGSEYIYDDRLQITQVTDGRGIITTYTYDDNGNKLTKTEAVGTAEEITTSYTYTTTNRVETITVDSIANPGSQKITTNSYDSGGNLLTRTEAGYQGTTPISKTTTYTYNSYGQITSIDGPRTDVSDTITLSYYPNEAAQGYNRGMLNTVSNSLGHTTTYSDYNVHGQAETITDANGLVTTRTYTVRGLLSSFTTGGLTTSYVYDDTGELQSTTLPGSRTITYGYDTSGRIASVTDSLGNSINYSYDTEGRRTAQEIKDPQGTLTALVNYTYDDNGNLHKTINPDTSFTELSYDEVNNLISRTNELSQSTSYNYDELDRLIEVNEPDNHITAITYDKQGNQTSITDAAGQTTSFTYDDFGNRLSRTASDTGLTSYSYDLAGNLITRTDSNNITTTYSYDSLNRPVSISYPDTSLDISYTYDQGSKGIGRLSSVSDGTGTTSYSYNQFGSLTEETRVMSGFTFTTSYGYNDNQELVSITYPSGRTVDYQRDTIGRVTSVSTDSQGQTTVVADTITYLPFGPAVSRNLGNGLLMSSDYDQQYRLTGSQAATIYDRDYTYLATGQVETIVDNLTTTSSQSFNYDNLGRLTGATGSYGSLSYAYDQVGNRTSLTDASATQTYTYMSGTNLLEQINGTETTSFSYDAAGNTLAKGDLNFTWNDGNRLESLERNTETVGTYGYDARGLRTIRTTATGTVMMLYDGAGNLLAEVDQDGKPLKEYVYLGGERLAMFATAAANPEQAMEILALLSDSPGTTPPATNDINGDGIIDFSDAIWALQAGAGIFRTRAFYYINDHLSTAQLLTDDTGTVVWQGEYRPFGGVNVVVNQLDNLFRFPGQVFDEESGLYYNWHRFYDPATGRYISADPIGLAGGMNLYAYVGGNPVNAVDPFGLFKYKVRYNTVSAGAGPAQGMKIFGTITSLDKGDENSKCPCEYEAIDFEGYLGGAGYGRLINWLARTYNNQEIFSDEGGNATNFGSNGKYKRPDVRRIAGVSSILGATGAFGKNGVAGGMYNFGYLTGTNEDPSSASGYDLGLDALVGWIKTVGDVYCKKSP